MKIMNRISKLLSLPSYTESAPSVYKVTSLHDHIRGPFTFNKQSQTNNNDNNKSEDALI